MNFRFGKGSKSKTINEETSKPAKSPQVPPSQQPSQAACLIDIPECFESVDVIQVRTASLPRYNVSSTSVDPTDGPVVGSLGPVDLVQIVKVNDSNEEVNVSLMIWYFLGNSFSAITTSLGPMFHLPPP